MTSLEEVESLQFRIKRLEDRVMILEHKEVVHDEILAQHHDRVIKLEDWIRKIGKPKPSDRQLNP